MTEETITAAPPSRAARVIMAIGGQGLDDDHARVARTLESMSGVVGSETQASMTIMLLRAIHRLARATGEDFIEILKSVDSRPPSSVFGGPVNAVDTDAPPSDQQLR